jgi:hypothetical protein
VTNIARKAHGGLEHSGKIRSKGLCRSSVAGSRFGSGERPPDKKREGNVMFIPFYSTAMLALESCDVVSLRLAKLMFGGSDAHNEAHLMVSEKINAMFEATASVVAGGTASSVVDRYRELVAANAKRLSR